MQHPFEQSEPIRIAVDNEFDCRREAAPPLSGTIADI